MPLRTRLVTAAALAAAVVAAVVPAGPAAAVGSSPQTIGFDPPASLEYAHSVSLATTSSSGLPVTLTSTTPDVCVVIGADVIAVGIGTCSVTATQDGDDVYAAADPVGHDFPTVPTTPTITVSAPPDLAVGGSAQLVYSSSSRWVIAPESSPAVAVTSLTPDVCTVADTGGLDPINGTDPNLSVTGVGAGTCTLQATQDGNSYYDAAVPVTRTLLVSRRPQTVTFTLGAPAVDRSTALTGTADSGLPIDYTSLTPGVCTVVGTTVVGVSVGLCSVAAAQAGDATYLPAATVVADATVAGLPQALTLTGTPTLAYGASALLAATSDAGLPVTVESLTGTTCGVAASPDGWVVTGRQPGPCSLRATQAGDSRYAPAPGVTYDLTVVRADQVVAVTAPAALQAASSSPVPVTATSRGGVVVSTSTPDVCTVQSDGVPGWPANVVAVSAGTCTLTATQAGDSRWNHATTTVSFPVTRMAQTVTAVPTGDVAYATSVTGVVTASSGEPVDVTSSTPSTCTVATTPGYYTVTATGVGTCRLQASQAGTGRYAPATTGLTVTTVRAGQDIRFPQPGPIAVGLSSALVVAATSGLPVGLTTSTPAVCVVTPPATVTALAAGTCRVTATQAGDAHYTAAADQTRDIRIGVAPQHVTFPPPATAAVGVRQTLTATADSALPVAYSTGTPGVCAVERVADAWTVVGTAPGLCDVTATQGGDELYLPAAPVTTSFSVLPLHQTISFALPATGLVGATLTLAGTATSGLPVTYTANGGCTIDALRLTLTGVGPCTVTARQSGNGVVNPAPAVTATVSVSANHAPTVRAVNITQLAGSPIQVSPTVTDLEGDAVTLSASTGGRLVTSVSGERLTITAPPSASGRITVTLTARDARGAIGRATFTDTVTPRAVTSATVRASGSGFTVAWPAAATAGAAYEVAVNGARACVSTRTSCSIPWRWRTTMRVTVVVLGRDGTRSGARTATRG